MSRILHWFAIVVICCGCGLATNEISQRSATAQQPAATGKKPAEAAKPATNPPAKEAPAAKPVDANKKADGKNQAEDEWSVIYLANSRVGYSRSNSKEIDRNGQKLIRSESQQTMTIKRFGHELKMQMTLVSEETPDGQLIGFEFRNDNPPNSFSKTTGKVVGDKLQLTVESGSKPTNKSIKWDPEIKAPAYQDRVLQENPLKAGETRKFKMFLPEFNQVTDVTLKEMGVEQVKLLEGKTIQGKRIDISQTALPGIVTKTWMDAKDNTSKTSTSFFGSEMATYRVSRDEALREIVGKEMDIAVDTLIKIDPPLERAHLTKQVVYQVTISGSDPAKEIPSGDTQTVKSTGPETAEVTVTSIRPAAKATEKKVGAEFLEPNRYLQSDDKRVIDRAEAAAAGATTPWDIAVKMELYVQEKLTKKNFSTALASAAEVAQSMEGDCTEHACLLAAMCRVKKIPSRVVVGLVYAERFNAFGGHMWTEVFLDGKWIPLDATLGDGGIGAAHLKLSDTSFSDNGTDARTSFLPILKIIGHTKIKIKTVEYQK